MPGASSRACSKSHWDSTISSIGERAVTVASRRRRVEEAELAEVVAGLQAGQRPGPRRLTSASPETMTKKS